MYRGLSSPRIKQYKSVPCFRIVSSSIHRDALRACAARPNRVALCVYRAARCGHRALRSSIGKSSVGADAYIGPPYRTPCNVSLRDQFANWSWQSVPPSPRPPCLKRAADRGIPLGGALLGPGHPSYPIYLIPFSEKSKASPVNFL